MKLKTATLLALTATANNDVTGDRIVGGDGDRKVPKRHPLQRLWRLYQFSEEIILLHYYRSTMKKSRVDAIRELIKKWLYMGQRETFLRGTKKCGFYDSEYLPHGGPAPLGENGQPDYTHNQAIELQLTPEQEFSGYRPKSKVADQVPKSIEIFRVRDPVPESHRVRRHEVSTLEFEQERVRRETVAANVKAQIESFEFQLDGDFDDDSLDNESTLLRLKRDDPCKSVKQVFIGFRKWADRYIANCDGQATYQHMHLRALKFYNEFRNVCAEIPRVDISYVKPS